MDGVSIIIGLCIGLLIGGVGIFYIAKLKFQKDVSDGRSEEDIRELISLKEELATKSAENNSLREKVEANQEELKKQKELLKAEFENLANKILEQKSQKFTEQNKANLDMILSPLKEKIEKFEQEVQKTNKEQYGRHEALKQQLGQLKELNNQMSEDAKNLVKALQGDNKASGNWGEMILEKVLEKSGLRKGHEYTTQESHTSDEGRRLQPDAVIKLPENKNIVIDSKVSLVHYERYASSEGGDDESELKSFIDSIRAHLKSLSEKNYQTLFEDGSLDFVLMFIPIEPAFSVALQNDDSLYAQAYDRNIIIVSPSTLLATLRTIANIWKHEYQNQNVLEIANEAGKLYDKFVAFSEDLKSVGNRMRQSKESYDSAMRKLVDGPGNLVSKAEKVKKLGAKTTKAIDEKLVRRAEEGLNGSNNGQDMNEISESTEETES